MIKSEQQFEDDDCDVAWEEFARDRSIEREHSPVFEEAYRSGYRRGRGDERREWEESAKVEQEASKN